MVISLKSYQITYIQVFILYLIILNDFIEGKMNKKDYFWIVVSFQKKEPKQPKHFNLFFDYSEVKEYIPL